MRKSAVGLALLLAACGGDSTPTTGTGGSADPGPTSSSNSTGQPAERTAFVLEPEADLADPARFFDAPYPLDTRLDATGHPRLEGFPNPTDNYVVRGFVKTAAEAVGFPVIPLAHFRFTAALPARDPKAVLAASPDSPVLFVDLGADSPTKGQLIPTLAGANVDDLYTPSNVFTVAPRPGFVLRENTTYGVVVKTSLRDAAGNELAPSALLEALRAGEASTEATKRLTATYAPLWPALDALGVPAADVAAATVFTTGAAARRTAEVAQAVVDAHEITLEGLALHTEPEGPHPQFCELRATVKYPQFQRGTPPFDDEGLFAFDAAGAPVEQRVEEAPVVVLIPRSPMPVKGYPLAVSIHGSGGFSDSLISPVGDDGKQVKNLGPAIPITAQGIAMAGSAMPLNPERFSGATETQYLNTENLPAMRDTFRQGIVESRLFVEALGKLAVSPEVLGACTGPELPAGATAFKFDGDLLMLTGQSMGGMYANMLAAVEPKIKAVVPTGAGGHWTYFLTETELVNGPALLSLLLETNAPIGFLHPVMNLAAGGLEAGDPIAYMPHVARRPFAGHPVRHVYEPVGKGDSYFPTVVYDAVALAYGHPAAGPTVWPSMLEALALDGRGEPQPLPVRENATSEDGSKYTGAVVQFEGAGDFDPHAIYVRREDVKHQYACFFRSFVKSGGKAPTVPALADYGAPCE